ncbi:hypothetical protein IH824_17350 [candidate division KSB1 bacterium]|nr:hypothetical protein [candidate division KSB1 bacterium]
MIRITQYIIAFILLFTGKPEFGDRLDLGLINNDSLNEVSGLAASRKNSNVLWTHNDSGDENRVFAIDANGKHLGTFLIEGAEARDWEDIAVGPGPIAGKQYLYIGDIGDNLSQFDIKHIYRVMEPEVNCNQPPIEATLSGVEAIAFQYPDGKRDAETLMVDPLTKDIYIVSKRESNVRVYRAPYPQSTTRTITLEYVVTLNLNNVVGGDISPSGNEVVIKTYKAIYYWRKSPDEKCWKIFDKDPISVPYIPEPQGEAVCWRADGLGYYTVSEEPGGIPSHLYFYPRLNAGSLGQIKSTRTFHLTQVF